MESESWLEEIFDGSFAAQQKRDISESESKNASTNKRATFLSDDKWVNLGSGRVLGRSKENNFCNSVDDEKNQLQSDKDSTLTVECMQTQLVDNGDDAKNIDDDDVQVVFSAPPASIMQCVNRGNRRHVNEKGLDKKNKGTMHTRINKKAMKMFRSIGHEFMETQVVRGTFMPSKNAYSQQNSKQAGKFEDNNSDDICKKAKIV